MDNTSINKVLKTMRKLKLNTANYSGNIKMMDKEYKLNTKLFLEKGICNEDSNLITNDVNGLEYFLAYDEETSDIEAKILSLQVENTILLNS